MLKKQVPIIACFALFTGMMLLSSCDSRKVFDENKRIPGNVWDMNNKVKFVVHVTDTITPNNFYINIRNGDSYPYSNLYLFINTEFPGGGMSHDTLECILASDNGKWLGKGLGDIWDNRIPFKRNVRFPKKGDYTFTIQQAMRKKKLPMIMDVGMRIERVR